MSFVLRNVRETGDSYYAENCFDFDTFDNMLLGEAEETLAEHGADTFDIQDQSDSIFENRNRYNIFKARPYCV